MARHGIAGENHNASANTRPPPLALAPRGLPRPEKIKEEYPRLNEALIARLR